MDLVVKNWLDSPAVPEFLKEEIRTVHDEKEIRDRFYCDLAFGTGGLRGKIGAGTNRMNILTIGLATAGLAEFLIDSYATPSVCIAYDTRRFSKIFACHAASVLCGYGISVYLFSSVCPTPMLSFAVRYMNATAGIVITASHNPREYNGYKVYGADGGQITDEIAKSILLQINQKDILTQNTQIALETAEKNGLFKHMDVEVQEAYFSLVKKEILRPSLVRQYASQLKIVYTPLHGTGNIPVRRVLKDLGFENVFVVPEQEKPDEDFPTVSSPNPEDSSVFELALQAAHAINADIVLATDPDCDRIGVLCRSREGDYAPLTGNQMGALLCDYIIKSRREMGVMPCNPAVIKTIVTSDLGKRICEKQGIPVYETLTGFKYIGELAEQWDKEDSNSFLFGYEESYGYLVGDFVRDKDAVISSALISEMALYHYLQNRTLIDALQELQEEHGFFAEELISVTLPGPEGKQEISRIMEKMRREYCSYTKGMRINRVEDYYASLSVGANGEKTLLSLPKSNVLKLVFEDGSWLVLRPSGTEPKIKIYLSAVGENQAECCAQMDRLKELYKQIM